MDLLQIARSIPVDSLIGLLVFLPFVAGALVFVIRGRAIRTATVLTTAWILTLAALVLLFVSAIEQHALLFTPPNGAAWAHVITMLDFALMAAFCVLGAMRKSPLILGLAVLQLAAVSYVEFGGGSHEALEAPLRVDWLSIVMVLIVSIIGSIIATYALPYMRDHETKHPVPTTRQPRFFLLILVFLGAMNGLVLADNLLWLMCFWEMTTLCSFLLIGHDGTQTAVQNAYRALWMNLVGGVALAVAMILFVHAPGVGTLSVQRILDACAGGAAKPALALLALACICLAGFTKAAQMPFQSWLLGAMVAPTPVSALLHSSTMVKAGVYIIARFAPAFQGTSLSMLVALAGGFTFAAAAALAIGQSNAKSVLAYSTISNLGLIVACIGLNTPLSMAAAVMLIIFHAVSKGLLFMAVGVVDHTIGSRDIEDMRGLVNRMPLTTFLTVVGILSMLLPPFGVLIAKLAAIEAAVTLPPLLVVFAVGSALTVVFWTKWTGCLLSSSSTDEKVRLEKLDSMYVGPLILLTAGVAVFSLCVVHVLSDLVGPAVAQSYQGGHPSAISPLTSGEALNFPWLLVFAVLAVALGLSLRHRARTQEMTGAYMCGEQTAGSQEVSFVTVAEEKVPLTLHSDYYGRLVGEDIHRKWMTAVGIVFCLLLFGAASPWK